MQHKTISLADQVFGQLEADILSGVYTKGEVLTELKLCETMGVSRTPIREALRRLLQEHLLEESGKGCVVLGLSREDLSDIYLIRAEIEPIAAKRAALNATEEELEELKECLDLQEFFVQKGDIAHIRETDSRFHDLLYRSCHSTILYDTLLPLHKKVQKFRGVSVRTADRAGRSLEEHRLIFSSIRDRNAEAAEEAAVQHIQKAFENIIKEGERLWD